MCVRKFQLGIDKRATCVIMVSVMTSLTAPQILTRLGWEQTSPNTFRVRKFEHPTVWRLHRVNQYLFTLCLLDPMGGEYWTVRLGTLDEEVVRRQY